MINFIVCDDNKEIVDTIVRIIDKEMMGNNINYKSHTFYDYDSKFIETLKSGLTSRIYILDIEMPSGSGIDIARMIREKDMDSVIIFLTSHNEMGYTVLKNEFMFLSFISKFDDYQNNMKRSIKKALEILGKKKVIKFEERGSLYTIPISDIVYITRDTVERKCIIYTDYTKFVVNKKLSELIEQLGDDFRQSHRSCIVNMNKVLHINYVKKKIIFNNGTEIDLISSNYKKEVIEKC